jgi:hypothetical protein
MTNAQAHFDRFLLECAGKPFLWNTTAKDLVAGRAILDLPPDEQAEVLNVTFCHQAAANERHPILLLQAALLKKRLLLSPQHADEIAARLRSREYLWSMGKVYLGALESYVASEPLSQTAIEHLKAFKAGGFQTVQSNDRAAFARRIDDLLGLRRQFVVIPGDAWSDLAIADLSRLPEDEQNRWIVLLEHCQAGMGSKPSSRWLKQAGQSLADIGEDSFVGLASGWFTSAATAAASVRDANSLMSEVNLEIIRGLIAASSVSEDSGMIQNIGRMAVVMFQKIPGVGPRSAKLGNICVFALGQMSSLSALAQLAYLKSRIKLATAQRELEKALQATATRLNVPREDLEELAVPAYGLTDVGRAEEPLGDFTAEITLADSGKTITAWRKADGKVQKSVPASVKADHAEELKELKAAAKDIERIFPAQRERLDGLYLQEKRWPVEVWRERYLDHPLVGVLARRLIWTFRNSGLETSAIWLADTLVNVDDQPIDWIDAEGTTVELWHPIGRPMDDVLAWRHWLERHEIRQPFKQAHREVYVLTDAERRTATYSNRYAAHVLRQHQFNALCAARGWRNQLRLMVDASYTPPTKWLERWGLRAEFWIETIGDNYGTDTTDSGTYLYLTTDQVRFYRPDAASRSTHASGGGYVTEGLDLPVNQPLPLELIPPIVFSEVMRDVDLFVGVASVGNDPTWADGGPEGRYREYWQTYSFGDLTPTAQTRKQVLERLVPRLKIGSRCSFSEKFLVVRGDLRTYKIHLGSGNILMEPNDQYLCIVPDGSAALKGESVFLPFEGDRTLSIILSKAMLLADDLKITDRTIIRQIKSE